ncbi:MULTISPECIES: PH domain-containing protein [Anaerolinea]|uniref:PH domain-containing protein n=1 Tax=Anaerolinea TaxID=233189 RepID=UPI0026EEA30F|nr:PH domain-containing protein [Anaerolinea thermophila]
MSPTYLKRLLGENEQILLTTHQHWIVLIEQILVEMVLAGITILLVTIFLITGGGNPGIALGYLLLIIPLVSLIRDVLKWWNHQYIVTNLRVIQITGILNKNVTDSSLEKVNDVKMVQSVIGRFLNYGDLEVLTASEMGVNRFTRIANPIRFKTTMLNAKIRLDDQMREGASDASIFTIPRLIEQLDELRKKGLITEDEFNQKKAALLAKIS